MLSLVQSLLKRPTASAGAIAVGAALAISSFSVVAATTKVHPDKTKNPKTTTCASTSPCETIDNTGPALSLVTSATNTRSFYVSATASGADGTDISGGYIGVIGRAPAGTATYPLVLTDANGNDLDYTDGDGDIYYKGSLNSFVITRHHQQVVAYAPRTTTQTIEDVGSGRLVNGQATVALDRTFADSIDLQAPYHVFLTPNGDTRGLYVANKTPTSFVVRETQGGRGTLLFDYRVVAAALGHASDRMGETAVPPAPHSFPVR
jgi:hypothetical protein